MDNTESEQLALLDKLFVRALQNKHSEQQLIRSKTEYRMARMYHRAIAKVAKGFNKGAKTASTKYLKNLRNGIDDANYLMDSKVLKHAATFYKEELDMISDRLNEYHYYVLSGHLFATLFNNWYRPEEDLKDARFIWKD